MKVEEIREALRAEPFAPFRLRTAGGQERDVDHPELALITPGGHAMVVVEADDVPVVLSVPLIELPRFSTDGKGKSKRKAS